MGCVCSKGCADSGVHGKEDTLPAQLLTHKHADPGQALTDTADAIKAAPAAPAFRSQPHGPTDSASSAHAFMQWAGAQASTAQQPLDQFVSTNSHVRRSSNSDMGSCTSSSCPSSSGRPSMDEWASSAGSRPSSGGAVPAFQPHNAHLQGAPAPPCQEERVVTANAIHRMRSTADGELESMLGALCLAFGVDTALMALLTGDMIAVCGACGILSPGICPDRWGFCGWSFVNSNHELLVIEDTRQDARFADNFFAVDPAYKLTSYMAAPLISSDGHRLGTLCILGQEPCTFNAARGQFLSNMAELLVRQLERNWVAQLQAQKADAHLERSLACYDMAYMLVDVSKPDWRIIYVNKPAQDQLGVEWSVSQAMLPSKTPSQDRSIRLDGMSLDSYFDLRQATTTWAPHCCEFTVRDVLGAAGTAMDGQGFRLTFSLATNDGLDAQQPFHVGVPAWLDAAGDGFGRSLFFVQVSRTAASSCGGSSVASTASVLTSWSAVLSSGQSTLSFKARGLEPDDCPIEGLVLGPLLGKGSYGRVYRGVYKGMPVAVKIISDAANLTTTPSGEPLEAMLTQGIKHLGIMRTVTYAYTPYRKACWMLFEFCDRTCVQDACVKGWFRTDRRPTKGGINLRTVALTAYEIASAMAFLHKHDVVHGDLKGGNVMLSSSPINVHGFTAKVGDFGLARHAAAGPHCPSNAYGTVTHMPPEVLLNGNIGKPTDVYSFGVLLWEMLTGSRAWAGMKHTQIICQVALLKRSLAVPQGLPPVIQSLLVRSLALQVSDRCTFEEVLVVLSDFLQTSRGDDLSSVQLTLVPETAEGAAGTSAGSVAGAAAGCAASSTANQQC